ncbi:PRC-barrel domain protein [Gloeothece citriformis PCC 7424]|uniref:PRC-barrel domain protein n=1 Tax=Gloeothece citriformis (strain PCC 7424) TaxID=65393 RepID=B7KC02_GLOC7|nr:PRC-barrel domain-containing protein [Gloeothece citriformis]ACK68825.1 PRC-barrel domain protein [Gloeothece citriformis PCC 7424]
MVTENFRLRSEYINTQVITRNTGKKLGVVKDILVDLDRREVVALGLRDNILALSGMPQYMYLSSITQTGDVILVEDEEVFQAIDIDAYTPMINSEVITETGEPLGRVRDFQFNAEDGRVSSIIIASIGLPQIPEQLISTYEISIEEVISSGPNRLIVIEGAETRLTQVSIGLLERLGIGRPPWEKEEEEVYYPPTARPENQLPTGIPVRTPIEAKQPVVDERWDEDEWEPVRNAPPVRRQEALRYEEEELEEDNWGETKSQREPAYEPMPETAYDYEYDEVRADVWDDDVEPEPYNPPRVNIPEKQRERIPEYEEETRY